MSNPFYIATTESVYKDHHVYLYDFVDSEMTPLLQLFNTAEAGVDSIHIHIASCGGDTTAGRQLLYTIQNAVSSGVNIQLYLDAECHSMASVFVCRLILLGIPLHISDIFFLMFHCVRANYGEEESIHYTMEDGVSSLAIYKTMLLHYCVPILTLDEVERIMKGEIIRVWPSELKERCSKLVPDEETIH